VKNVLTVVQVLVSRTLAGKNVEAREAVMQRLHALARAHDLLMQTDWEGADLKTLVMSELSNHSEQVQVEGPDILLRAQVVQNLALVLHELCTNAVKYGAFSNEQGWVSITWATDGERENARFKFRWQEHDGPPVHSPVKKGFGSTLLQIAVSDGANTGSRVVYKPDGLLYEIDVLLSTVQQQ
jgi:two-component system, chemotaxis family, CheB/CheR fusion protein